MDEKTQSEVAKVLSSGHFVQGQKVKKLEEKLSKMYNSKYAVVVNSGTAALHTALSSIGLREGDEVITTPFSFIATANAILMCGGKPKFVDIKEDTFTINPDLIEAEISSRTKAILTVDLYGKPCDYEKIKKIAKKYDLKIISDCAQAIGARYKNKPISKWVDITCFSFYATKNIMMGEGGALVTNDKKIYEFSRRFRQHGADSQKPYLYHHIGYNYRSTDILATIALSQINFLDKWTRQRYLNAKMLISKLKNIPGIILPVLPSKREHVFHQFTIRVTNDFPKNRDQLHSYLLRSGVQTGIYYPSILASYDFIKKVTPYKKGMYPISQLLSEQVLSLPVHPWLSGSDINLLVSLIKKAYEKN